MFYYKNNLDTNTIKKEKNKTDKKNTSIFDLLYNQKQKENDDLISL